VRTSRYIFPNNWGGKITKKKKKKKKKKVKQPTHPIFLGHVTLITHIFFIWPYFVFEGAAIMHLLYGDFFLRFIRVNNPSISQSINQS
jgi:hypothetical protein